MSEYFPEPESSIGRVKVESDFSKAYLKDATGADTSLQYQKMCILINLMR